MTPRVRMRGRGRGRALAALVAVSAAGCSLGFHPSDYEDDTKEGDAAPTRDGGSGTDATLADAADGGGTRDAAPPPGADASDGSFTDAPTGPYCTTIDAAFCSDFDEGSVGGVWDGTNQMISKEGSLTLDTTYAVSLPGSENSILPALDGSAPSGINEYLQKDIAIAATSREVLLDFDFSVEQLGGSRLQFVSLYFEGKTEVLGFELGLGDNDTDSIAVVAQTNTGDAGGWGYSGFSYPADGGFQWHHLLVDALIASGTSGKIDIYLDHGTVPILNFAPIDFIVDPTAVDVQLRIGLQRVGTTTPAMNVHFDNVAVSFP